MALLDLHDRYQIQHPDTAVVVVTKDVKWWSALSDVDWDMFLSSSSDVSEFTDVATSFIGMLEDTIIPTIKVRSFPNQKPWVDGSIRDTLHCCLQLRPRIRPDGRIQRGVLRTAASGEGHQEETV